METVVCTACLEELPLYRVVTLKSGEKTVQICPNCLSPLSEEKGGETEE